MNVKEKLPVWLCNTCGAVLGFYMSPQKDGVRIKYKDLLVYVTPEPGSIAKVERACRQCGAWNVIYVRAGKRFQNKPLQEQLEAVKDKIAVVIKKPSSQATNLQS